MISRVELLKMAMKMPTDVAGIVAAEAETAEEVVEEVGDHGPCSTCGLSSSILARITSDCGLNQTEARGSAGSSRQSPR